MSMLDKLCLLLILCSLATAIPNSFKCDTLQTSASIMDDITTSMLPPLQRCEEGGYSTPDCDVYFGKANVLLAHQFSRSCKVEDFRAAVLDVVKSESGNTIKSMKEYISQIRSALTNTDGSGDYDSRLAIFFNNLKDTLTGSSGSTQTSAVDLLTATNYFSDSDRTGAESTIESDYNSKFASLQANWNTYLATQVNQINTKLISSSSSSAVDSLEDRMTAAIENFRTGAMTAIQDTTNSIRQGLRRTPDVVWSEMAMAYGKQFGPTFIPEGLPSVTTQDGKLYEGKLDSTVTRVGALIDHTEGLGFDVSVPRARLQNVLDNMDVQDWRATWRSLASTYDAILNVVS